MLLFQKVCDIDAPELERPVFQAMEDFVAQHDDLSTISDLGEMTRRHPEYKDAYIDIDLERDAILAEADWDQLGWDGDIVEFQVVGTAEYIDEHGNVEVEEWLEKPFVGFRGQDFRAAPWKGHDMSEANTDRLVAGWILNIKAQGSVSKVENAWRSARNTLIETHGAYGAQFDALMDAANDRISHLQKRNARNADARAAYNRRRMAEQVIVRKGNVVLNVTRSVFETKLVDAGFVIA